MDPPGDQNDGFVLEGLNDDFVLKAAFGSGQQREPLSTVDLLDVVPRPQLHRHSGQGADQTVSRGRRQEGPGARLTVPGARTQPSDA